MAIAVVTGASSGMGAEFCRALDGYGLDSIWIIARRDDRLRELASELKTPCKILSIDLSDAEGIDCFASVLEQEDPEIRILINCAGMGRFGKSWEIPISDTRAMIGLNLSALVEITDLCIPRMPPGSNIIEVCSASAYLPLENLNVYAASKAFVRFYCDGLRSELKEKRIGVLEVSPGWVQTDFIPLSKNGNAIPQKVFKHTVAKEAVVAQAMKDMSKGRNRSICGGYNRFQVFCCIHCHSLASYIWRNSLKQDDERRFFCPISS